MVEKVHYFFAPYHARYDQIAKSEWHQLCLLVAFKYIEFAVPHVENASVFDQRRKLGRLGQVNLVELITGGKHG